MLAAQAEGGLAPVLVIARQFRLGKWIEQYLVEARKALTGMGVTPGKELAEKAKALPKLTNQASFHNWRNKVELFWGSYKDGAQLCYLVKTCVPLRINASGMVRHPPIHLLRLQLRIHSSIIRRLQRLRLRLRMNEQEHHSASIFGSSSGPR